jgi:hypothetical protein
MAEGDDMKLQIHGQQVRLRIDEDELQQLRDGSMLSSSTHLPGGTIFRFLLELSADTDASMIVTAASWRIALPTAAVDAYVGRLPCRDGLDFVLPVAADAKAVLGLAFEVDVRDSVRRRGVAPRHR